MRNLVVFGVGELGKLFGSAALRAGIRVTPITRAATPGNVLSDVAAGTPLLIAVGERALPEALDSVPTRHRADIILLQNELFPAIWEARDITPSVLVPWVLQKRGVPTQAAGTTPYFGKHAPLLAELLDVLALPSRRLIDGQELAQALVDKYAFILTINTLGVLMDRTLGLWLQEDAPLVWDICREATQLGQSLCGVQVDAEHARRATEQGMVALAHLPARGRTARERVERAVAHAHERRLQLPGLASALA